ncbi:MAG: hypothetical protein Q9221_007945 [Calogaya cf. arnoldii]
MESIQPKSLLGEHNRNLDYKIAHLIEITQHEQMASNIHQYSTWAHEQLETEEVPSTSLKPPMPEQIQWEDIAWEELFKRLTEEQKINSIYWHRKRDWDVPPKMPELTYFDEFGRAAGILRMQFGHVRDLTKAYSQQKPNTDTRGINQFINDGDWAGLAQDLSRTKAQLGWFFRHDPLAEASMRCVLERIKDHFFKVCHMPNWNDIDYALSKEFAHDRGSQCSDYDDGIDRDWIVGE